MPKDKILLMGTYGSGKTSMRSIIFANYLARETSRLGPTLDVAHDHIRFLGRLNLNLWDCGGQEIYLEKYLDERQKTVFSHVKVLIYVFDIKTLHRKVHQFDPKENRKMSDLGYYTRCLTALKKFSPDCKVFVLIHKMDLVAKQDREKVSEDRRKRVQDCSLDFKIQCFNTSIWDATLYKAWSAVVETLIPNMAVLQARLDSFCDLCEADELVLFEQTTFLVIAKCTRKILNDHHRFEKISNIVKQFKLACGKARSSFDGMTVQSRNFTALLNRFTSNTFLMVITPKTEYPAIIKLNISASRDLFEKLLK